MSGIFFLTIIAFEFIMFCIFLGLLSIDGVYHEKPPVIRKPREIKLRGDNYPFE